jgi:hypothetical protein
MLFIPTEAIPTDRGIEPDCIYISVRRTLPRPTYIQQRQKIKVDVRYCKRVGIATGI